MHKQAERREIEDALQRQNLQLRTLLETAEILSTTLRFGPLLEEILSQLQKLASYDAATVSLVHGDKGQIISSRGSDTAPLHHNFSLDDRPLIRQAIEEKRPVVSSSNPPSLPSDVDEITAPTLHGWSPSRGSGFPQVTQPMSWLVTPLMARGRVIGALTISSHAPQAYDEETTQLVSAFAHQTALALENSRLYEQTRSQLREVTVLQGVTAAISSTLDIDQVLPYVARSLCEMLNATSVEIYSLRDCVDTKERGRTATLEASYAADEATEKEQETVCASSATVSLSNRPHTAEALRLSKPVEASLEDPDLDPSVRAKLEQREARSMLLLPIRTRDQALGFAYVWDSATPRQFTEGEIATGQTLIHQTAIAMENVRLIEESQRRANQLAGAADIARHVAAVTDPASLLNLVVDLIQERFGLRLAAVFLVDEVEDNLYPAAATEDFWDIIPDGYRQPIGKGAIGRAAQTGETVRIMDASKSATVYGVVDGVDSGEWLSPSSLSVPIKVSGLVIGVLEAEADVIRAFTESDQIALEVISDQIAIGYRNAELLTETRSRMKDLQLLHDVSLAAASSTHLQETLQAAAEALAAEWKGTQIALHLIEQESKTLAMKAWVGHSFEQAEALNVSLGEGITGWVAQHGEPVLASDIREDPRYYTANSDTRSELCVPLSLGNRVLGTLNVESAEADAFTLDDQRLLTTLGSNLAMLIERARLFEEVEGARAEVQQRAEALEQANARLKELDRLKSQFLANMSHELRTPLNSVIGFSEVLIDGLLGEMPPERKECVENIYASGEHLMALINDILDLSKIEAGRIKLSIDRFEVRGLIENVRKTVTPMIDEKSQTLTVQIGEDLPPLNADRIRVRQILLNLLSNAHKFTPEGNEISLSCRLADPATMLFSVSDTGVGVRHKDQELIFEEFRQADETATREAEGTGLGLTISRRLVEMHGGTIWVESTYGEGATFSFLLPLAGPTSEVKAREGDLTENHPEQKVLIIEDDRQFSNLLSLYLRKEGYQPIQHYQGSGVLEQARRLDPALITLDIMLPRRDGWEILQQLKSDPQTRDIPVLVISALRNSELALSLGATDYLAKPVDRSALQTVLNRLPMPGLTSREPKILVIDDDAQLVPLLEAMLLREPCTLIPAYDGKEGLAKAQSELPDGILLDLMMPGINGFEVLEELKSDDRTADTPVVVLTAKSLTEQERNQLNKHIETLMHKSALTPQAVMKEIQRIGTSTTSG